MDWDQKKTAEAKTCIPISHHPLLPLITSLSLSQPACTVYTLLITKLTMRGLSHLGCSKPLSPLFFAQTCIILRKKEREREIERIKKERERERLIIKKLEF